jgi:hypothetical protein
VALVVRFRFDGYIYSDDKSYLESFAAYAGSNGKQVSAFWDSVPSYSRPLGFLFRFVLNDPLTALLPTAFVGSLSAVLVAFTVKQMTSPQRGIVAGLLVAVWPSQIFWSSLALRDAFIWFATSLIIAVWAYLLLPKRAPMIRIFWGIIITVVALTFVAGSRRHSAVVLIAALLIAIIFSIEWRKSIPALLIVGITAPYLLGFGPFAWNLLKIGSSNIEANRAKEVAAAETVVECWDLPILPLGNAGEGGWRNDLLCLPATAASFLLAPTPQQVVNNPSLTPLLMELPFWVMLYAFSARNLRGKWRNSFVNKTVICYLILTILMWSLVDRAIGTAFRHRGEILASLVLVAMMRRANQGDETR